MINKEFIEKTVELSKQREELETEVDERYDKIFNRVSEMRSKIITVLYELRYEMNDQYGFNGCASDGTQKIRRVISCEDRFTAIIDDYDGGEYWGEETISVPYDSTRDDEFVQQFKEKAKQEYLEKKATKEREEYLKAKQAYDKLKKNFEASN